MLLADAEHDKTVVDNVDRLRRECLDALADLRLRLADMPLRAAAAADSGRERAARERARPALSGPGRPERGPAPAAESGADAERAATSRSEGRAARGGAP